jgi:hypothetical protein
MVTARQTSWWGFWENKNFLSGQEVTYRTGGSVRTGGKEVLSGHEVVYIQEVPK